MRDQRGAWLPFPDTQPCPAPVVPRALSLATEQRSVPAPALPLGSKLQPAVSSSVSLLQAERAKCPRPPLLWLRDGAGPTGAATARERGGDGPCTGQPSAGGLIRELESWVAPRGIRDGRKSNPLAELCVQGWSAVPRGPKRCKMSVKSTRGTSCMRERSTGNVSTNIAVAEVPRQTSESPHNLQLQFHLYKYSIQNTDLYHSNIMERQINPISFISFTCQIVMVLGLELELKFWLRFKTFH
ncbi:uncharacterized protein LOC128794763 [Vidua chalybeata]|uniref:uncharacterized protein LOC128794763 n=1 Tax=Vidua chalybeata TaxID=81927 RepID=UPI0023A8AA11|nr:uncharacterized protein LOC128794763 [Vidua chalybeata]